MKVTAEGERAMGLLGEIVAAKGLESNSFIDIEKRDVPMVPRVDGPGAVNVDLVRGFMANYPLPTAGLHAGAHLRRQHR